MARQLRIEYPGALYHLLSRGDRGKPIFRDDRDKQSFLETLGEACAKTGWQVHAYCLLEDHFHLVLKRPTKLVRRDEVVFRGLRHPFPAPA